MKKSMTFFIGLLLVLLAAGYFLRGSHDRQHRILKLAHGLNTQHPVHRAMEFMARRAFELSGGELEVQIFPSEQLGNEKEMHRSPSAWIPRHDQDQHRSHGGFCTPHSNIWYSLPVP